MHHQIYQHPKTWNLQGTPHISPSWVSYRLCVVVWMNWTMLKRGLMTPHRSDKWFHDDVIKWKHFPRYWPFVWVIHLSPVNSPHKGHWRGALMFSAPVPYAYRPLRPACIKLMLARSTLLIKFSPFCFLVWASISDLRALWNSLV